MPFSEFRQSRPCLATGCAHRTQNKHTSVASAPAQDAAEPALPGRIASHPGGGDAAGGAGVLLYLLTALGKYRAVRLRLWTGEKLSLTEGLPLP